MLQPLSRLRWSLTIWYAATLGVMLALLGGGLYLAIRNQYDREMRRSLRDTTARIIERATSKRGVRLGSPAPAGDEDVDHPDRTTYVIAVDGSTPPPPNADAWVLDAAARAARTGALNEERDGPHDTTQRLHAERFELPGGRQLVAVVVDRSVELEDRYASLIAAFGGAAVVAVLLVAAGGRILVRQASAPVEQTIEHMRRFMADAAHELRTPVTIVRTRAEIALQQARQPGEYVATLRGIESEARHLGDVVDSLFMLARAEAGERSAVMTRVYLDDIVLEAAEAASVVATTRGVTLTVEEFDEAAVDGDTSLLRQLVMNLLDNAIKYTPAGGRVIVRVSGNGGRPVLAIEDTGIGIASDALPHIFDRFYRADVPEERGRSGAGLGLSIARWIAERHRGVIDVRSEVGKGTRVTVRFPPPGAAVADGQSEGVSSS